jgi:hypothetical protein
MGALAALTACAPSHPHTAQGGPSVSTAASPATASPTKASSGQAAVGKYGKASVYGFQATTAPSVPSDAGSHWAAVDAQVCLTTTPPDGGDVVTNTQWHLVGIDTTEYAPAGIVNAAFPQSQFPVTQLQLTDGRCVRGWVIFAVPNGAQIQNIKYSGPAFTARWTV